jgi:hypothetical protein
MIANLQIKSRLCSLIAAVSRQRSAISPNISHLSSKVKADR